MAIIHVDGKQFEVDPADNLLQACLSRGVDLPYFCWHPALGSVGACRQCAVKIYRDENDKVGRLVMACMTPAADNTRITLADPESKEFREAIISLMMTNHPHDCPVCEEGGHCHLQDMTVMTGHYRRQYHFTKRTHLNQELGPFIAHEMNRCISCYRCVRFYNDYAGGTDFGVFGSAAHVYFGREAVRHAAERVLRQPHRDLPDRRVHRQNALGALRAQMGHAVRAEHLRRLRGGLQHLARRALRRSATYRKPLSRRTERLLPVRPRPLRLRLRESQRPPAQTAGKTRRRARQPSTSADAIARVRQLLASGKPVVGIGSPRASLEANYRLRALVGADAFSSGMTRRDAELTGAVLKILREGPVAAATIRAIDDADAVLVLGEDVLATAPRVALALRQAARGKVARNDAREKSTRLAGRVGRRHRATRTQSDLHRNARPPPASTTSPTARCASRRKRSRNSASRLRTRSMPSRRPASANRCGCTPRRSRLRCAAQNGR